MSPGLLTFLDWFFLVFHTALVLFNTFGWIFYKLRLWNLATLVITGVSWFAMGLWKGIGYCVCTDWHWQIRDSLGNPENSETYIQFLVRLVSGWEPPFEITKNATALVYLVSLLISASLNVRDIKRRRVLSL